MSKLKVLSLFVLLLSIILLTISLYPSRTLKFCSGKMAYIVNYEEKTVTYDDGLAADQFFEMQSCGDGIEINQCFTSIIDVAEMDYLNSTKNKIFKSVSDLEEEKITYLLKNNEINFNKDGSIHYIGIELRGEKLNFYKC